MVESTPAHLPARSAPSAPPSDSILEIVARQRNIVGIAVGVCVFLALFYLLIATRYYSGYARLFVQQTQQMLSLIHDAESGQRGYLLTGDAGYLPQYTAALPRIAAALQEARTMVEATGRPARVFLDFLWSTKESWSSGLLTPRTALAQNTMLSVFSALTMRPRPRKNAAARTGF